MLPKIILLLQILCMFYVQQTHGQCEMPEIIRGSWFSWNNGRQRQTIIDHDSMSHYGKCNSFIKDGADYTFVFKSSTDNCYRCVKTYSRSFNVFEKIEGSCVQLEAGEEPTVERICNGIDSDQNLVTLFNDDYIAMNCQSSIQGVWQFSYRNRFRFTGECDSPDAKIQSCQSSNTQSLSTNQKFEIAYKQCEQEGTFNVRVEYACLGDWFVGDNHYFAVANTRESRKEEKYRCFVRSRSDDSFIGVSITPECHTLKTVKHSPEILRVKPIKVELDEPGCRLPQNFSGDWANAANVDAELFINETHLIETFYQGKDHPRQTTYVCKEQRDSLVVMARTASDGCQTEYVCFDFALRHHNIARLWRSRAVITSDFKTVCSPAQFPSQDGLKYELFSAKYPVPVQCPIAGKFNFTQQGKQPFITRPSIGVTLSPRPDLRCIQNVSILSVCETNQTEIMITENHCLAVDYLWRRVNIHQKVDYSYKCIGFFKENSKSYLITYDDMDPFSKYQCWVYERVDSNRILISQAFGAACHGKQNASSSNYSEGANVALVMTELGDDECPVHFDDGSQFTLNDRSHILDKEFGTSSPAPGLNVENSTLFIQLMVAIKNGDVDYVQKIFANEHQFTRTELDYVMRYAVFEAHSGSEHMIDILVKNGATIDAVDEALNTPLHFAALLGNVNFVNSLIKAGANVSAINIVNETPLFWAAKHGHEKIADVLIKNGADVNAVDHLQNTPLHEAAKLGYEKFVELLMNAGATDSSNKFDRVTPSFLATLNGHFAIAEMIRNASEINPKDDQNTTMIL